MRPEPKYDVCVMYRLNGVARHYATPRYDLKYPLAKSLCGSLKKDYPIGYFLIPVPNGKNPLTHLREKEDRNSSKVLDCNSNHPS